MQRHHEAAVAVAPLLHDFGALADYAVGAVDDSGVRYCGDAAECIACEVCRVVLLELWIEGGVHPAASTGLRELCRRSISGLSAASPR